jgi:hypothetical protein
MGNRACIVFFDRSAVSPTIYLHWHAHLVPDWLEQLKALMADRTGDAAYAAARFVGLCHLHIPGALSLGISSNPLALEDLNDVHGIQEASPGDGGFVVVSAIDFGWTAYGGYLADNHRRVP